MHHILTVLLQIISDYISLFFSCQFLFPMSASSLSPLAAKSSLLVLCSTPHPRPTRTTSTLTCVASCAWVHLGPTLTASMEQHLIIPARTSLESRGSIHAGRNLSELVAFQDGHEMLSLTVCVRAKGRASSITGQWAWNCLCPLIARPQHHHCQLKGWIWPWDRLLGKVSLCFWPMGAGLEAWEPLQCAQNMPDLKLWTIFNYWSSPNFSSQQISCADNICNNRELTWGLT